MITEATGTVTYVDGANVLAFGHPLFGIGEVYLPMVDAEIHAFLPSFSQSFKMSSPLNEVGTLVQDRQSCILGDLDSRTTMMPVEVRVSGPGVEPRVFHAEVARNRRLTPTLASLVISNALVDAEPDIATRQHEHAYARGRPNSASPVDEKVAAREDLGDDSADDPGTDDGSADDGTVDDGSDDGATDEGDDSGDLSDDSGDSGDSSDGSAGGCPTDTLKPGAVVNEADVSYTGKGAFFDAIELAR